MKYTDENRGFFQAKDKAKQLISYKNLRIGNITPTDSDGEVEYHNRAWIFFEIKQRGKYLPFGQRLCLQRKADDISRGGKEVVVFVADHTVDDPETDIDAADCLVRSYYFKNRWWKVKNATTLREYILRFVQKIDQQYPRKK